MYKFILIIVFALASSAKAEDVKLVRTFEHIGRHWVVANVGTYVKLKDNTFHEIAFSKKPIKDVLKKDDDSIIIVYDPKNVPSRGVRASTWEILYSDIENGVVDNPSLPEVEEKDIHRKVLDGFNEE